MKRKVFIFLFSCLNIFVSSTIAQDDLLEMLEEEAGETTRVTQATFKATRIMNGHSIERMPEGQLDVRIHHRFGRLNTGAYEFFGIDQAEIHLGLEYGIKDWVMVGIGRGNYQKTYDGFTKFSILRQSSGAKNIPVSLSAFGSVAINSLRWQDPVRDKFSNRLSYTGQILIARKFSERFSLQLSPTLVHRNYTFTDREPNTIFALGAGGRFKITSRVSFNAEYYYVFAEDKDTYPIPIYNPLSLGFDIETGGHVFQLIFTNSVAMIEKGFITETTGQWGNGDVHFGFNISRVFTLY